MNMRKTIRAAAAVLALAVVGGWPVLAAETPAKAPTEAALVTASGRPVFWRGEQVGLSLTAPLAAPAEVVVILAPASQAGVAIYRGKLGPVDGAGQLFDYDPCGFPIDDGNYNQLASYWGWGNLAPQLKQYLAAQQQALVDSFKKETGFDAVGAELTGMYGPLGSHLSF